jgi:hypothetical protein
MKESIIYYVVGYLYSLLIGTWLTHYLADYTGKAIGEFKEGEYYRWTAAMVGVTERLLYTSAILFNKLEFIGIWFLLKVASQWRRWGEKDIKSTETTTNDHKKSAYRERANFNSYLINTGLSLAYGVLGGEIIIWLKNDDAPTSIAFGLGLILLNAIFIGIAYLKYKQSRSDEGKKSSTRKAK